MGLQSAQTHHHSVESALLKVRNNILLNMEAQKVTLLVLLDLSAAFNTFKHDVLLQRLKSKFGVNGKALEWFTSYLMERTQHVSVMAVSPLVLCVKGYLRGLVLGLYCLVSTRASYLILCRSIFRKCSVKYTTRSFIWQLVQMSMGIPVLLLV